MWKVSEDYEKSNEVKRMSYPIKIVCDITGDVIRLSGTFASAEDRRMVADEIAMKLNFAKDVYELLS